MRRFALLLGVALSLPTCSAIAQSCDGFVDVLASSQFCPDVTWMKTYGVTKGCDATHYCPTDNVSRLQMAAFMHRLGNDAFLQGGNAFGTKGVLGTLDNEEMDVIANGVPVIRAQPAADFVVNGYNPNVIAGQAGNAVSPGVFGATIAGGGGCNPGTGGDCIAATANQVAGQFGTVGGGQQNSTSGAGGTVGGGEFNTASGNYSAVAGGYGNTASGLDSTVIGGVANTASGDLSTVAGGYQNTASGLTSFAAGSAATADQNGCFVFANWSSQPGSNLSCGGFTNIARFGLDHGLSIDYGAARMDGGGTHYVAIGDTSAGNTINAWNNAVLTDAGVWVNGSSSQTSKTDFAAVNTQQVLAQVASLPITTWRFKKGENGVRHMGPMAEDFWTAFQVGYGPQTIADLDARGVALAAIQGLNAKVEEQQRDIDELRERVWKAEALAADVVALKAALAELRRGRETVAAK